VSLFFDKRTGIFGPDANGLLGRARSGRVANRSLTTEQAMRHSAVWACTRLRADLISTSPVDVYRDRDGRSVKLPTPDKLVSPAAGVDVTEWLYSTQMDLDRFGNCFGLIGAWDSFGLPTQIELLPAEGVTVLGQASKIHGYRYGGTTFEAHEIWHERQFTTAGCAVGLSPLAHAAMTIHGYLSAQTFAHDWFTGSAVPASHMKNTAKVLTKAEASEVKDTYRSSVSDGDVLVTGADWEFSMIGGKASESEFLNSMKFSVSDVCRFLGVPGDMIDAEGSTGSITYANVTQRNLQLLIMNLGPAITRRERALSRLLRQREFVKLNTDAVVLRMDPTSRAEMNKALLESGQRTLTEVREKDDLPARTDQAALEATERANALGVLVRSGFDPEAAAKALGLPAIKHTGAVPITVQNPNLVEGPAV
jgi:HK97 family phage portal protein